METVQHLSVALFQLLGDPIALAWIALGMTVGIVFGATPGLTATMGVAVFIPITYALDPEVALGALIAIYCGGIAGGSIRRFC